MVETSLETLRALWEELHNRLKGQSADYRTLLALEAAMRSMEGVNGAETRPAATSPARAQVSAIDLAVRVTQAEAAQRVLETRGVPMTIDEIIKLVPAFGGKAGSRASLSSSLSQAPQFVSIRHQNRWCWWLTERSVDPQATATERPLTRQASRAGRWRQIARSGRKRGRET